MILPHKDKLIIVTGASRGVGRATVLSLVNEHGCRVIAIARDVSALTSLVEEAGERRSQISTVAVDLSSGTTPTILGRAVLNERVHGLVNNAGSFIKRAFGSWTSSDLTELFATNVFAPLLLLQGISKNLSGDPAGHVVNIGSMGGFQGSTKFPGLLGYSASKAALANVTECMAEELKDQGIRANCLCFGSVDTEMLREAFPGYQALVSAEAMGGYVAQFVLEGHKLYNGKVLPVALSTP